jgi:GxxExxY protein
MITQGAALDELTEQIIGCAIQVHEAMGPGLLESIYKTCLVIELRSRGFRVETERPLALVYREIPIASHFRLDIVVEQSVVIEVKAITTVAPVHRAQVVSYLKLTGCPVGLLLNFNVTSLKHGVRRLVRPDLYRAKSARTI